MYLDLVISKYQIKTFLIFVLHVVMKKCISFHILLQLIHIIILLNSFSWMFGDSLQHFTDLVLANIFVLLMLKADIPGFILLKIKVTHSKSFLNSNHLLKTNSIVRLRQYNPIGEGSFVHLHHI